MQKSLPRAVLGQLKLYFEKQEEKMYWLLCPKIVERIKGQILYLYMRDAQQFVSGRSLMQ